MPKTKNNDDNEKIIITLKRLNNIFKTNKYNTVEICFESEILKSLNKNLKISSDFRDQDAINLFKWLYLLLIIKYV